MSRGIVSKQYIVFLVALLSLACDSLLQTPKKSKFGNDAGGPAQLGYPTPEANVLTGWGGSLAYNELDNNWLVLSQATGIFSVLVSHDGFPISSPVNLTPEFGTQQFGPKAVFVAETRQFFVMWIGFLEGPRIYGRFLNRDGTPAGPKFLVHEDSGGASFVYQNARLRYDGRNKKFVYVWEYRTPDLQARLITIGLNGTVGAPINVTTAGSNGGATVAVNENANEYCVAYKTFIPVGGGWIININVKPVNAVTGQVGAESTAFSTTINAGNAQIEYNTVEQKYLVSWEGNDGTLGTHITGCNGDTSTGPMTLDSRFGAHSMAFNPRTNTYLVIGQNQNDGGNSYSVLEPSGLVVDSGVLYTDPANNGHFQPIAGANTRSGNFVTISGHDMAATEFVSGIGLYY